jgi:hypothetical protein
MAAHNAAALDRTMAQITLPAGKGVKIKKIPPDLHPAENHP